MKHSNAQVIHVRNQGKLKKKKNNRKSKPKEFAIPKGRFENNYQS